MSAEATKPGEARPQRRKGEGKTYRNFVGGQWVDSESPQSVPNINPADTREVLGHVPLSTVEETQGRGGGGRATPSRPGATRRRPCAGRILFQVQALMDKEKDDLARLLTREEGKTVKESMGEIQRTINILEYIGGRGPAHRRQHRALGAAAQLLLHAAPAAGRRSPASRPGTSPSPSRSGRSRPRWSRGNTVVFKPATLTPGDGDRGRVRSSSARACPRACSTWSWARAAPSATRSSTTTTCARSASPARNEVGAGHLRARRPSA